IGGTVGDIESLPYIEAVRQLKWELNEDAMFIHLTLVPFLSASGELKTKPTQHSVKTLLEYGVQPDVLVCRTEHHLNKELRNKIARFCNVDQDAVIESIDAKSIYEVPVLMKEEKLDEVVLRKLSMPSTVEPDLSNWSLFLEKWSNPKKTVRIGLVGKYVELKDSYKSIAESFIHAGAANQVKVELRWIHSEKLNEENVGVMLDGLSGLLVAPGFGSRGIEGKICAIKHAREYRIPFLGICLGMQCAVIEFARNVLNLKGAHTTEIDPDSPNPVIDLMDDQKSITDKGGTMRLGAYPCELNKDSVAYHAYGRSEISERHRHRYEFNNDYLSAFEEAGMSAAGINPLSGLVEIIEIKDHPWFVGVQFHPEYKSTVAMPHPIFNSFVKAVVNEEHLVKA
ncbi:MAG TPA: CTP synthase, partial [Flavobacteriales bacterium]|nr:CTP synthase [Flavobacteriales bacterium]